MCVFSNRPLGNNGANRHTLCARNVRAAIDPRRRAVFEVERWRKEQRRPSCAGDLRLASLLLSSRLVSFPSCLSSRLPQAVVVRHRCRPFVVPHCLLLCVSRARPSPAAAPRRRAGRVRCAFLPSGCLRPRDVTHSSAYYAIQDTTVTRSSVSLFSTAPFRTFSCSLARARSVAPAQCL